VVSQVIANLEAQLGVTLFDDRTGRYPQLTGEGRALLVDAREVAAASTASRPRPKGMAAGLEPELSVVIRRHVPMAALTERPRLCRDVSRDAAERYVEALGAVTSRCWTCRCSLGVIRQRSPCPGGFQPRAAGQLREVSVVAPRHPLARYGPPIPTDELARHVQLC